MEIIKNIKLGNLYKEKPKIGLTWRKAWRRDYQLYLLLLLPVTYYIIFKYIPMAGIVLAFRKYIVGDSIFGSQWVGFRYFSTFIKDPDFWNVFKNTFLLSFYNLLFGFPLPIIFALLLNEIKNKIAKKFVQTVSYLPRFFSTVVVVGMMHVILSPSNGIINKIINSFGLESIYFIAESSWFRFIYNVSEIWQFMGWNAIIYIAALTNIDIELYEAAFMDGANRWKQTLFITIPGIMPTIIITLILACGYILSVGFEKVLLLYSPIIYDVADVLQTYVYRMGIISNNYSYATAIGLFQSIISLIMIWGINFLSKRTTDTSLW